jgi:hypothetical protein
LKIVASSGAIIVYTLTDTNATVGAKSNVFEFTSTVDTLYFHYESNGDVSNYATFSVASISAGTEWVLLPAASQQAVAVTPLNTFVTFDTIHLTGAATGSGSGTDVVATHSLSTEKTTLTVDAYSPVFMLHTYGTVNTSFAPSLGFITRNDQTTVGKLPAYNLNLTGGTYRFLIAYNLK